MRIRKVGCLFPQLSKALLVIAVDMLKSDGNQRRDEREDRPTTQKEPMDSSWTPAPEFRQETCRGHDSATGFPVRSHHLSGVMQDSG
jgi:hypothetical protein